MVGSKQNCKINSNTKCNKMLRYSIKTQNGKRYKNLKLSL
jgi:hypothetical protein